MTLTRQDEEREDIRDDNRTIGYIMHGVLYGIDPSSGYAETIGEIEHPAQAVEMLKTWRAALLDGRLR